MKLWGKPALLLAVMLTVAGCSAPQGVVTAAPVTIGTPEPTYPAPAKLTFTQGTKAAFFGDSWTYGQGVSPLTQSFAYVTANELGLDAQVFGVTGTGYLSAGPKSEGVYAARMDAIPASDAALLIIQGSVNDQNLNPADLVPAVRQTLDVAKVKFPKAQIVLMGPARNLKTSDAALAHMDDLIHQVAMERSLNYVSPINAGWITADNVGSLIDPATNHPSVAGHKALADKLAAALQGLR